MKETRSTSSIRATKMLLLRHVVRPQRQSLSIILYSSSVELDNGGHVIVERKERAVGAGF